MSDPLAMVLMLAAVAVLLVSVVVWIRPLVRPSSAPAPTDIATAPDRSTISRPLAEGFGYLFSPLGLARRQTNVGSRLERALRRIDSVDPYAAHRRIGLALLQTGERPETRPAETGPRETSDD